ncbi:MAG: hypothetical protein GXY89_08835 [Tissierellia bacterium]|jgi:YbbR domain-containing protein|nr:hypothetical protein [Tissierellia bacterium]
MDLRERLNKNKWSVKLVSLIMAIFLWSYVMGVVNPVRHIDYRGIEIQFTGVDYINREGLSILSPQSPKVNVRIEGTRSELSNISTRPNTIVAEANLSGVRPGENVVNISVSIKEQTGGVRIINVEPSQIVVNIDEIVTENLEISVEPLGNLPEGYTLGNIRVIDNYVRVTAPKTAIDQIVEVVVYPVISDKTETFMINSPIIFLDKNQNEIQNLSSNIETADIEVPIYRLKSVPIRPLVTGTIGQDEKITNIRVVPENVVIRGTTKTIDSISYIETEELNLQDLVGAETHEVDLKLPEGVTMHDPGVDFKLEYEYINNVQKNITVPRENFYIKNENSDLDYTINTEFDSVNVILYGESSLLDGLTGEDIKIFTDVKGLSSGEYLLEFNIDSIEGVTLREKEPTSISIIITNKAEAEVENNENGTTPEGDSSTNEDEN